MRASGLGIVVVAAVMVGCGRSDPAEGPAQAGPPASNPLSAPVDYLGATAAGKKAAEKTVNLAPVLSALQQDFWHGCPRHLPDNFCAMIPPMGRCGGWLGLLDKVESGLKPSAPTLEPRFDPMAVNRWALAPVIPFGRRIRDPQDRTFKELRDRRTPDGWSECPRCV